MRAVRHCRVANCCQHGAARGGQVWRRSSGRHAPAALAPSCRHGTGGQSRRRVDRTPPVIAPHCCLEAPPASPPPLPPSGWQAAWHRWGPSTPSHPTAPPHPAGQCQRASTGRRCRPCRQRSWQWCWRAGRPGGAGRGRGEGEACEEAGRTGGEARGSGVQAGPCMGPSSTADESGRQGRAALAGRPAGAPAGGRRGSHAHCPMRSGTGQCCPPTLPPFQSLPRCRGRTAGPPGAR